MLHGNFQQLRGPWGPPGLYSVPLQGLRMKNAARNLHKRGFAGVLYYES